MIEVVRRFFENEGIPPSPILVAVSGGVDSTALLLLMADLRSEGFRITAAHVNHHLRGDESDGDEQFIRSLAKTLDIPLLVADGTLDPESIRESGLEAAARAVRHEKLAAIARSADTPFIATAHQLDDQAETVLMRLMTGTGLAGLRAIHPRREDGWIRPLLEVTRRDIEAFLNERGITPRIDHTNADPRFLRNRVRVMLRDLGPGVTANLAAVARQAQEVWPAIEKTLDAVDRTCTLTDAAETRFLRWPDDAWLRQALLNRHIRRLGGSREVSSDDLRRLAAAVGDIRRVSVTRELELIHRHGALVLRRKPEPAAEFEAELFPGSSVFLSELGATIVVRSGSSGDRLAQRFQLPRDAEPRFVVRNRRRGDRFQPLGMSHDKKLKDFLIDRKIDAEVRDSIPLLLWNGEIVWVAGVEVSERFKVTTPPEALYEVKLEDASKQGSSDNGL
ncbi:MAG TPA: tRNA lysidine(34) synthetase TilS [Thermoanaerobaculia bacterium]|nr:tRNA lysidine(34) synthetase TilS [Thermoanaerobaculia bacterium]